MTGQGRLPYILRAERRGATLVALIAVLFLFLSASLASAGGLGLTAIYGYDEDETGRFLESYNTAVNLSLDQPLSPAMSLTEDLRYGRNYKERSAVNENVSPSAQFSVSNDIFNSTLAATQSERRVEGQAASYTRATQADISSAWKKRWWPDLHLGVGSDRDYDDLDPRMRDREVSHLNSSIDWHPGVIGLYYDYSMARDRDKVSGSESDSFSHLAKFTANKTFWRNRLSFSFSHSYNFSSSDNGNIATSAGLVFQKLLISQALSVVDTTPLTGALTNNPGLNDGNRNNAALTVAVPGQGYNIAARLDLQTVDYLYLYTTTDVSSFAASFNWRLYTSGDGINWTQVTFNTASVSFNPAYQRFEIPVGGLSAIYVKVVLDYSLPSPLPSFSEIEAYDVTAAAAGTQLRNTTDVTTRQTSLNLGLRATESINFSYSLGLYNKIYDPGKDSRSRSQTGSANWHPNRYFDSTATVGDNWHQDGDELENLSRSYGLRLGSSPLDTLDLQGGTTFTESWRGETKITRSNHYDFDLTAQLYPDLRGQYKFSHDNIKTVATGVVSKALEQTLEFTSDLTPRLSSTLSGDYAETDSGTSKDTTYKSGLSFSWHPGDLLSLSLRGDRTWHPGYIESQVLTASLNAKTSANTQLDLDYTLTKKDLTTHSGTVNFRWNLTRWLYWQTSGIYQSTSANEFMLTTRLTSRFETY